jgi:uncharacterized protein
MKYLIWLVVLLAVVVWFQRAKKSMLAGNDAAEAPAGRTRHAASQALAFPAPWRQQCRDHGAVRPLRHPLPVLGGGGACLRRHYCSEEHRRLASF